MMIDAAPPLAMRAMSGAFMRVCRVARAAARHAVTLLDACAESRYAMLLPGCLRWLTNTWRRRAATTFTCCHTLRAALLFAAATLLCAQFGAPSIRVTQTTDVEEIWF